MMLTEIRSKQERADPLSLLQPSSLPLARPGAKPNREPAGKAEMWFAEPQFQHHKAGDRGLDLELRDINLTNGPFTVRIK